MHALPLRLTNEAWVIGVNCYEITMLDRRNWGTKKIYPSLFVLGHYLSCYLLYPTIVAGALDMQFQDCIHPFIAVCSRLRSMHTSCWES
jgi:hypothetical protein